MSPDPRRRTIPRRLFHHGRRLASSVVIAPIQAFIRTETSSSIILLAATLAAVVWANSPWKGAYGDLWASHFVPDVRWIPARLDLLHVVNDGLMTVFFFVAGLEIKRELLRGELKGPRKAALPIAAALGGMLVPALIYAAWNASGPGSHGWGIPMATDIAFSLGALALLGSRAPFAVKAFLLALAIADDLGAIAVIVLFYSGGIEPVALVWAVLLTAVVASMGLAGVRSVSAYVAVGALLWLAVFESGIHATVAGVVLAALTPASPDGKRLSSRNPASLPRDTVAPLDRLESALHPWVSYAIVPLFALANAGVSLSSGSLHAAAGSTVTAGVAFGLLVGKPTGIMLFAWLALRLRLAALPGSLRFLHIAGASLLAGIGFTVSLFVTGLAFGDAGIQAEAKVGILAGSLVAGLTGIVFLWIAPGEPGLREP